MNRTHTLTEASRLRSWFIWDTLHPQPYHPEEVCQICGGWGLVEFHGTPIYCICSTTGWSWGVDMALRPYRSKTTSASLEDFSDRGQEILRTMKDAAFKWMNAPTGYFLMSGGYGVGKSHILRAMNTRLAPIALYLTAADFESLVFSSLRENSLDLVMLEIARAPILLLDDLGSEYGSDLVKAKLTAVVDFRYRNIENFPMAVATNLDGRAIRGLGRIGSRLMDRELCQIFTLLVPDYRLEKRA